MKGLGKLDPRGSFSPSCCDALNGAVIIKEKLRRSRRRSDVLNTQRPTHTPRALMDRTA